MQQSYFLFFIILKSPAKKITPKLKIIIYLIQMISTIFVYKKQETVIIPILYKYSIGENSL